MTSPSDRKVPTRSSQEAPGEELDVGSHLGILLEYRGTLVAMLVLTLLGGALYSAVQTPVYRANTVLQFE